MAYPARCGRSGNGFATHGSYQSYADLPIHISYNIYIGVCIPTLSIYIYAVCTNVRVYPATPRMFSKHESEGRPSVRTTWRLSIGWNMWVLFRWNDPTPFSHSHQTTHTHTHTHTHQPTHGRFLLQLVNHVGGNSKNSKTEDDDAAAVIFIDAVCCHNDDDQDRPRPTDIIRTLTGRQRIDTSQRSGYW